MDSVSVTPIQRPETRKAGGGGENNTCNGGFGKLIDMPFRLKSKSVDQNNYSLRQGLAKKTAIE